MTDKNLKQVLAMSNSAVGVWVRRNAPELPPMHLRPVLGYCRFSSGGQHETSIEKQKDYINGHCEQKGLLSAVFFCDRARSGRDDQRPEWQRLIKQVRPGTIVVVHEMTRLARQAFVFLKMMREVHAAGGTVELVNASTSDSMFLTIMAAVAEYDYRAVVTRLRDGRVQAIAKGMPYRKPSYGFSRVGKHFVVNEDEAKWIRDIVRMRIDGATLGELVRYLVRNEVPTRTGGEWSVSRVSQILYSPLIAGILVAKRPKFAWEESGAHR